MLHQPPIQSSTTPSDASSLHPNDSAKEDTPEVPTPSPIFKLPPPPDNRPPAVPDVTWLYPEEASIMNPLSYYPSHKFLAPLGDKFLHLFTSRLPDLNAADYSERISKFFSFVCARTPVSRGQLLHSFILLQRLDTAERKLLTTGTPSVVLFQPLVVEHTLGTLILCSLLIAHKLNDDRYTSNTYWAKLLTITPQIVNTSEVIFLRRIDFRTFVEPSELVKLAETLHPKPNPPQ